MNLFFAEDNKHQKHELSRKIGGKYMNSSKHKNEIVKMVSTS